jgi:hypothetical protein
VNHFDDLLFGQFYLATGFDGELWVSSPPSVKKPII